MQEIYFVTGNKGKAEYASKLLCIPVSNHKIDLPEIQSLDLQEVVAAKLETAYSGLGKPVLIEDVSLEFQEYKRLPGTFIKHYIEEIGLDGLCKMLDGKSRRATAKCILGYKDENHTEYFYGELKGTIAPEPRGACDFGWDKIFIPDGFTETRAGMNQDDNHKTYLTLKRFDLLAEFLKKEYR